MADTIVTINRINTSELYKPLVVNLTVGGTATFGTDYTVLGATSFTATSASMTIPANQTSNTITLSSVPDTVFEPDETVVLTIVPTAGVSSGNGSVTWTILNDDVAFVVISQLPLTSVTGITDIKGNAVTNFNTTLSNNVNNPFNDNTGVRFFDVSNSRLSVGANTSFGSGAFSIDLWIYPTVDLNTNYNLLDSRSTPGNLGWFVIVRPTQILFADLVSVSYVTTPLIELNKWSYLCISRTNSSTHRIWVNGVLGGISDSRNDNIISTGNIIIGDRIDATPNASFTGYMSNFRISSSYLDGSIVPTS